VAVDERRKQRGQGTAGKIKRRQMSRATSSDTSSDQGSEVLNATTRTGSLYWPDIRSLMVVSRSASPRSVSANSAYFRSVQSLSSRHA
jgi:hypothetical protein